MTCVTGVSGSGKSTLVIDTLYKALSQRLYRSREKAGAVRDIARAGATSTRSSTSTSRPSAAPRAPTRPPTPASSPTSATSSPSCPNPSCAATSRGATPSTSRGGAARPARGDGIIKIEMHFLPDVYVQCEVCKGARYNRETLEVRYKGKIHRRGAGHDRRPGAGVHGSTSRASGTSSRPWTTWAWATSRLGQSATTLSGGEAQRVKLAKELSKRGHRPDHLHPRRTDHRPAFPRHRQAAGRAAQAGGCRQHRS